MSITVDYSTVPWLITVPKSDLTLESGTKYKLTVDTFWELLRDYADSQESMPNPIIYTRIPATASTPSITEVNLDYYRLQFEDGAYSVNITNGNTNIREAEIKNQVSVNTNNTTGFIDPKFLEAGLFGGSITFDLVNGYAGTDKTAAGGVIGTRQNPSNNWADAKTIADENGIHTFNIVRETTISVEDFSKGYVFLGDSPTIQLTLDASADVSNCAIYNLTITGELDGLNTVRDCSIQNVTNCSGFFEKCAFFNTFTLSGDVAIFECYSQALGSGYATCTTGSHIIQVRDWHGSLGISGMTDGIHSIEIYGGQLHLDNTCSGGTVSMRGEHSSPVDDQSVGTTVLNQTATEANWTDNKALSVAKYLGLK